MISAIFSHLAQLLPRQGLTGADVEDEKLARSLQKLCRECAGCAELRCLFSACISSLCDANVAPAAVAATSAQAASAGCIGYRQADRQAGL